MKNTYVNMFIQIRWLSLVVNVNIYMGFVCDCVSHAYHFVDMLDNLSRF